MTVLRVQSLPVLANQHRQYFFWCFWCVFGMDILASRWYGGALSDEGKTITFDYRNTIQQILAWTSFWRWILLANAIGMLSLIGEGVHGGEVKEPSTVAQTLASTMAGRLHLYVRSISVFHSRNRSVMAKLCPRLSRMRWVLYKIGEVRCERCGNSSSDAVWRGERAVPDEFVVTLTIFM
jgi:hypothetical protein